MSKGKVLLGMSGGADSSVSAVLLQEQGYEVYGVTLKLFDGKDERTEACCGLSATADAKRVCDKHGWEFMIITEQQLFRKRNHANTQKQSKKSS